MFIRRTQTRQTASGETYYSHRLVRSERVGRQVRQRTLLNLGRHFEIPRAQWRALCTRLEQLLGGQQALVPIACPQAVEEEAQRLAAQLLAREGAAGPPGRGPAKAEEAIQAVEVDSLELVRPRSVGVEHLGRWALEQVGFVALLERVGFTGPQRAAAVGSIIGRMAAPGSERATHRWLRQHSALGELVGVDYETLSLMQLYRASDALMAQREVIEQHLFNEFTDLFGLSCTVTLYDLTNTYFEGEVAGQPKAQRGLSKEKRSDCPLLTLGLVLDGSGFVRGSQVFEGNVREAQTLAGMLERLNAPTGALVVMDRGIATEANIAWLRQHHYRYLVVSRERTRSFDFAEATTISTANHQTVHLKKVAADDGEEVRLYCYSEQRAEKERGISRRFAKRFETELKQLNDGLSKPRTHKKLERIWERIGRLKERSHGIAQHYRIDVIADERGEKARAITWEHQPVPGSKLTTPGVYCLRSNLLDWNEQTLWQTYIMLTDLEAVFRSLKSELGLRPIYHHKPLRADGHLFITVLAYQFVQLIRRRLAEHDHHHSWRRLRETFERQCRITAVFKRADGRTLHVRKATRAEPDQLALYQALGLDPAPGGVHKMIV
jgi:transposase